MVKPYFDQNKIFVELHVMCDDIIVKVAFIKSLAYDDCIDKPYVFRMGEMLIVVDFACFCKTKKRGE